MSASVFSLGICGRRCLARFRSVCCVYSQSDINPDVIDVMMSVIASQITSLTVVYSTVYSDVDQRKQQSSASLTFVRGIHRRPVNSPHKGPVTRKMFPFDDVITKLEGFAMSLVILHSGNDCVTRYFNYRLLVHV